MQDRGRRALMLFNQRLRVIAYALSPHFDNSSVCNNVADLKVGEFDEDE